MKKQLFSSPGSTPSFRLETLFKWVTSVYSFFTFRKKEKNYVVDEYEDIW